MFHWAKSFNGDLSKWDVSSVANMPGMFRYARSFNGDISKWDVSSVSNMDNMFRAAKSFNQKLCGANWVHSMASKNDMFTGSSASIPRIVCSAVPSPVTRQSVKRRPVPDRELIVRSPITTSVSTTAFTSTIANTVTCPKCGTFLKSGRASCCAPDGAWYNNCGGVSNRIVYHMWSEGVEACKRKFKVNVMSTHPHQDTTQ